MRIYHWPMSHNARKTRALARHLGIEADEIELSMSNKEHKTPEFLAINPMGQVPAIEDEDRHIWGGNATLIYLAALDKNSLLGESAYEWGLITQWMLWQSTELSPVVVPLHVENYFKPANSVPPDEAKRETATARFDELMRVLEAEMSESGFLVGERLTIADFAVAGDFSHREAAGFNLTCFPKVLRWIEGIESLPAWEQTQPPRIGNK